MATGSRTGNEETSFKSAAKYEVMMFISMPKKHISTEEQKSTHNLRSIPELHGNFYAKISPCLNL